MVHTLWQEVLMSFKYLRNHIHLHREFFTRPPSKLGSLRLWNFFILPYSSTVKYKFYCSGLGIKLDYFEIKRALLTM